MANVNFTLVRASVEAQNGAKTRAKLHQIRLHIGYMGCRNNKGLPAKML
jgi:hypothetical protein